MRCATILFLVLVIPAWLGAQEDCADGLVYDDVELYNLEADEGEANDLAPAMPDRAKALQAKLAEWRRDVNAQMPVVNLERGKKGGKR